MKTKEKIREPKILKKIGKLKFAGMSYIDITKKLKEEHGITTSWPTVKRVYLRYIATSKQIAKGEESLRNEIKQQWLDSLKLLREINQRVVEKFRQAKSSQELAMLAREIRSDIYLQEKVLKDINKETAEIELSAIEISEKLGTILKELERTGFIVIKQWPEVYKENGTKD